MGIWPDGGAFNHFFPRILGNLMMVFARTVGNLTKFSMIAVGIDWYITLVKLYCSRLSLNERCFFHHWVKRHRFPCEIIQFAFSFHQISMKLRPKVFFSHLCSVEEHILGQESQRRLPKSRRDVNLLESFLRTNDKDKKIENWKFVNNNMHISSNIFWTLFDFVQIWSIVIREF
jgi:hypothetical protein